MLTGSRSAAQLALGAGLPASQVYMMQPDISAGFGPFNLTLIPSRHSFPNLYPGEIGAPIRPPSHVSAYRDGGTHAIHIQAGSQSVLIHASAAYLPGFLTGKTASSVFLSVANLSRASQKQINAYFAETLLPVQARTVYPIHWDNFQHPAGPELPLLPVWLDDASKALRSLEDFCQEHAIAFQVPPYARPIILDA